MCSNPSLMLLENWKYIIFGVCSFLVQVQPSLIEKLEGVHDFSRHWFSAYYTISKEKVLHLPWLVQRNQQNLPTFNFAENNGGPKFTMMSILTWQARQLICLRYTPHVATGSKDQRMAVSTWVTHMASNKPKWEGQRQLDYMQTTCNSY